MTDNEPKGWEIQFDDKFVKDCSKHDAPIIPCHHWRQEDNVGGVKDFIRDNFIPKAEVRKVLNLQKHDVERDPSGAYSVCLICGERGIRSGEYCETPYNALVQDFIRALHISDK